MGDADERFRRAEAAFEAAHREDPRRKGDGTVSESYHRALAGWLDRLEPKASEPLRLAARCQHIRRWRIPRTEYPPGKIGYRQWRRDLAAFHADEAAAILAGAGYGQGEIERVKCLLLKENLKSDPECQALEDAICLVFLETEFVSFAAKHEDEKLKVILRKTLLKMSPRGHKEALRLVETLPEREKTLAVEAARAVL